MRHFLSTFIGIFLLGQTLSAQVQSEVTNLQVDISNTLQLSWNSNNEAHHWEVEASEDGKTFRTIGFVMGADPVKPGTFKFKAGKFNKACKYYRVLHVNNDQTAFTSQVVKTNHIR